VGFVSADLNNHAMANFITPVLEHLMHATRLEIHVYCNNRVDDRTTAYLQGVIRQWQAIQALSDQQLAEQIAKDGIDNWKRSISSACIRLGIWSIWKTRYAC
jgi:protein O-GlcNAc transferase